MSNAEVSLAFLLWWLCWLGVGEGGGVTDTKLCGEISGMDAAARCGLISSTLVWETVGATCCVVGGGGGIIAISSGTEAFRWVTSWEADSGDDITEAAVETEDGEGTRKVCWVKGLMRDGADIAVWGVVGVKHWFRERKVWDDEPRGVTGVEIWDGQAEGGWRKDEVLATSGKIG